jgi:pimeloyl-ACP methyl ester carboxylesterase
MPKFTKNDVSINYKVYGTGNPIILLHGAIVDFNYNYAQSGWIETLTEKGFQVIGIDFRGYGDSDKSTDSSFYGTKNFSNDVINLIHHLKLENVGLIGYSMGTLIALDLLHKHPEYFSKAVLIATGDGLIGHPPFILGDILPGLAKIFSFETFPDHLPSHISAYWSFLNEIGLDRKSMTAFSLANYPHLTPEEASTIVIPTLIISGDKDMVLEKGQQVAQTLAKGKYLEIKNADHFTLATERETHLSTVEFLLSN